MELKPDSETINPKPQDGQKPTPNETEAILKRDDSMRNKVHPTVIGDPLATKPGSAGSAQKEREGSQHKDMETTPLIGAPLSPPDQKTNEKLPLIDKRPEEKAKPNIKPAVAKRIIREEKPKNLADYQKNLLPEGVTSVESIMALYELERIKKKSGIMKNFEKVHKKSIDVVAITPDGRYIITGSQDNSIKIIDFETGALVHNFENAHEDVINDMTLTKDGKYLLSACDDGTVKMFDLVAKKEIHHFKDVADSYLYAVQVSHDGRFVFSGKSSLKMYDLQTKKFVQEFEDEKMDRFFSIALTPDDRYVVLGQEGSVAVYDLRLKQMFHLFENVHQDEVKAVATTPDGRYIISGGADGSIKIFELEAKEEVHHFKRIHAGEIKSIVVSADGKYLVSCSKDQSVAIFDLQRREPVYSFQNLDRGSVNSVSISQDSKYIAIGTESGDVKVLWLETNRKVMTFKKVHKEPIQKLVITPDNQFAITSSSDNIIRVFNVKDQTLAHTFTDVFREPVGLAVTSNSKFLLACNQSVIKIFDLEKMAQIEELNDDYNIRQMTLTFDDKFIILVAYEDIQIVEFKTKKKIGSFKDPDENQLKFIVPGGDPNSFIASDGDGNIKTFDVKTRQMIHQFKNPEGSYSTITITSDGKYLAIGSEKGTLTLYDLDSKQVVHQWISTSLKDESHTSLTSFQNRFILGGYQTGALKIFDLETKTLVHHIPQAHGGPVTTAAASSDGSYLVSTGRDNTMRFFSLQTMHEIAEIVHDRNDNFQEMVVTPDERYLISSWLSKKKIEIHDLTTKRLVHVFEKAHNWAINSIAVSPDSRLMVSGDSTGRLKVWDLENFKEIFDKEDFHPPLIQKVVVTMDSRYCISSSQDKSIKITDLTTFQQVHVFTDVVSDKEHTMALSPDGKFLLASNKGTIKMFDLATRAQVYQFTDIHQDNIPEITISPDSRFMISGSRDESVKLFDLQTKQFIHHFTKEQNQFDASTLCVTENSRYLVCGSRDDDIKVFDLETRERVQSIPKPEGATISLAVINNGKVLIAGSNNAKIKFFNFEIEKFKLNNKGEHTDLEYLQQEMFFQYNGMRSCSIFNSVDDFLFEPKIHLPSLISTAINCQELCIQPFAWTILHIVALQPNHAFIKELPEISKFKVPNLLDRFGKTPLHYLIANRRIDYASVNSMFSYICDYLEACYKIHIYEFQNIMKSLTMLIPFILNKIDPRHKERFLTLSLAASPVPLNEELPPFGHAASMSCSHDSPVFDEKAKSQIWKDGETAVSCQTNFLQLDYNAHSQDMKVMVDLMIKQKSEDFFKTPLISKVIDHLWKQAFTPLFISFLVFSTFMGGLSVYICLREGNLVFEIVLLALSGLLILAECLQMLDLGKDYMLNFWNLLDLSHLFLTVAFLITRIANSDDDLVRAWISTIVVVLGYLRWVSFLRIFQQTRNLIQVVITIAKDMLSFIVIIGMIIFGFSIIFLVFERENEYGIYLYNTYSILYGPLDIEDDTKYSVSLKLIMVVIAFLLNVLLLNLLISIMGDSYDKILEKREKTDSLTRLEMMSEAMTYMKLLKMNYKSKRGYLLYCLSMDVEDDENASDEWEGRINVMKKLLKQSNDETKRLRETTERKIKELNRKMDISYQKLEQRLEQQKKEYDNNLQANNEKLVQDISTMVVGLLQGNQGKGRIDGASSQNKMEALKEFLVKDEKK